MKSLFTSSPLALLLVLGCAGGHSAQPPAPPVATPVAAADAWRGTQPEPLPGIPRFAAPVPAQRMLPNRLSVLLRENHAVPVVVVELFIKTGVDGDPPGKPGLADDALRDYIHQSHVIVSQGLSKKKRIELGLAL